MPVHEIEVLHRDAAGAANEIVLAHQHHHTITNHTHGDVDVVRPRRELRRGTHAAHDMEGPMAVGLREVIEGVERQAELRSLVRLHRLDDCLSLGGKRRDLEQAAAGRGLFTINPDRDGIVRRVPMIMLAQGQTMPSLTFEMLRVATGSGTILIKAEKAGIGLYTADPFYARAPERTGVLLGYAPLRVLDIREGIRRLAGALR